MPLPKDFKMSDILSPFTFPAKIKDLNPNFEPTVTYSNGTAYPKKAGQTYVDITLEIVDGDHKGKVFMQKNINTGVYKSERYGKSQMYILMESIGVSSDKLNGIADQSAVINLNDLIGQVAQGIAKKAKDESGGNFYLDLRDPATIAKNKTETDNVKADQDFESSITNPHGLPFSNMPSIDNTSEVEDALGISDDVRTAPAASNSLFDS